MAPPRKHQTEVIDAIARMGGQEQWSVQTYSQGQLRVDPGVLLEMLLPRIATLLNNARTR